MNCLEAARTDVHRIILDALGVLISAGAIPPELIPCFDTRLCSAGYGNLSCNAALVSAEALGQTPQQLAVMICEAADLYGSCISELAPAANGFINIRLSDDVFESDFKEFISAENIASGLNIAVDIAQSDSGLDMLRAAVNAECLCRLVRYCGGNAEYIGESYDKYGVCADVHDEKIYEQGKSKRLIIGCKNGFFPTCGDDVQVRLNAARLIRNGKTATTHCGAEITPETLTDELPISAARYFFALDEPVIDLDTAYYETAKNPFYMIEKACSACNRAVSAEVFSEKLGDNEKNLILLACSLDDALRRAVNSKAVKPLCELAAMLSRGFVAYYYADFCADKRVAEVVLKTLEVILQIIGVNAPKKI